RAVTGKTDWRGIAYLYDGLVTIAPSIGALVGRAAALAEAVDAAAGWQALQALPPEMIDAYQPYWAVAAHLLARLKRTNEAQLAYEKAIGLASDQAQRDFLHEKYLALMQHTDV